MASPAPSLPSVRVSSVPSAVLESQLPPQAGKKGDFLWWGLGEGQRLRVSPRPLFPASPGLHPPPGLHPLLACTPLQLMSTVGSPPPSQRPPSGRTACDLLHLQSPMLLDSKAEFNSCLSSCCLSCSCCSFGIITLESFAHFILAGLWQRKDINICGPITILNQKSIFDFPYIL